MAQHLPFVLQTMLNRPLAVSEMHGRMIASALAGRLNIQSIETETMRMDARAMRDMASMGRVAADEQRAKFDAAMMTPEQSPYDGLWNGKSFPQIGSIAIVPIQGTLTRTWGLGPYSGATGYDGIQTMITAAMLDPSVRAIWLAIGSGGGAVDGCFDLQELIFWSSARKGGKKIVAMASDHAYSAAFALGVAADEFYVPQTGGVGSVGVIMLWADLTRALDAEGINVKVIRSGKRKAIGIGGVEPLDDEAVAHWQAQCDEVRDLFVDRVAEYRGISKSVVSQTEGLDYMGQHAKATGFVTDVLSEQKAWAKLEREIA